jgi:hypothetical protein
VRQTWLPRCAGKGKKCVEFGYFAAREREKNEHTSVKKSTPILFREFLSGCQTWRVIKIE